MERVMTYEELKAAVNRIIMDRRTYRDKDEIEREAKNRGYSTPADFIFATAANKGLVNNKPVINKPASTIKEALTHPISPHAMRLRMIYDSGYGFPDCDRPFDCKSFCEPWAPPSNTPYEQWSEGQKRMFNFIDREYREKVESSRARPISTNDDFA